MRAPKGSGQINKARIKTLGFSQAAFPQSLILPITTDSIINYTNDSSTEYVHYKENHYMKKIVLFLALSLTLVFSAKAEGTLPTFECEIIQVAFACQAKQIIEK